MRNFTKRQLLTITVIGIANFCNAICVSLQAPFYPQLAEVKGCTATEYGLVFGIFELVVFLISPIYGQNIKRIGIRVLFNGGIYTSGVSTILFGLLDRLDGYYPFIIFSFVTRIVGAMGNAAFLTASFAIIAQEFPDTLSTTFASLETFFGFGLIAGPTIGGFLYEFGGYTVPFAVTGTVLFLVAILTHLLLPKPNEGTNRHAAPSLIRALKVPGILLAAISTIITSLSIGFLQATLEPHLRQFNLTAIWLGIMFVVNGGIYAITAPGYGRLCDNGYNAKYITIMGTAFVTIGFFIIGPASFIPMKPNIWVTVTGLVLHGFGMSAQLVASFSDALRTSITTFNQGVESSDTFGLISGLWTSAFALGAFVGPTVSGLLYDSIGFRNATLTVSAIHLVAGIAITIYLVRTRKNRTYVELKNEKHSELPSNGKGPQNSVNESFNSLHGLPNGISIEKSRPAAMNNLIACNSYKSEVWSRREDSLLNNKAYSHSYGTIGLRNGGTSLIEVV